MASTIKVDTIQDQDGNNIINENANVITVGASGDTITIPAGATFDSSAATTTLPATVVTTTGTQTLTNKSIATTQLTGTITPSDNTVTLAKMAPGTDGNIISYDASGNPVAVATGSDGQVLTSAGAGAQPAFETLPVGGITAADTWKPSSTTSGSYTNITSWTQDVTMGTGMSHSSGTFTFPSTGFWLVTWFCTFSVNAATGYAKLRIQTTTDNSSYSAPSFIYQGIAASTGSSASASLNYLFDVTNTSTHKMKFGSAEVQAGTITMLGGAGTKATFVRLGDT